MRFKGWKFGIIVCVVKTLPILWEAVRQEWIEQLKILYSNFLNLTLFVDYINVV